MTWTDAGRPLPMWTVMLAAFVPVLAAAKAVGSATLAAATGLELGVGAGALPHRRHLPHPPDRVSETR